MADSKGDAVPLSAANLFNVNGLVAVVTGGGTGIGLMITKALVANGAKVYVLGRRIEVLKEAVEAIGSPDVVPITCDVTSVDSLAAAASSVKEQSGFVNLLVCNSGISGPYGIKPTAETTLDEFIDANMAVPFDEYRDTFAVNTAAVWYTTMSFLKLLAAGNAAGNAEQKSQVVAVSSIGGFNKTNTGGYAYSQSKAACTHLAKQLSVALPQWDIRSNIICPGLFPSQMSAPILSRGGPITKSAVPLERAGDEQDMGGAILYLASRAGAYLNGNVIITDGGRITTFPSTF
ncbi:short chain dehydrogenase [Xylariaceae sp. FL1019]|nr:short chain dehydrogenase [Xylariaceae sp. FL1019]